MTAYTGPRGFGSGTVTSLSVVSANGFAGSVATSTTTPAVTLSTTITGILSGNGTAISAATTTGSGAVVLATSPTLVTPVLGAATATTLNGLSVTSSTGTLTIANGKVVTASNTLTFTGTDSSTVAFGAGGTVAYTQSPTFVTPTLGVAAATSIALGGGTALANYLQSTFTPTVTLVGGAGNTVPVYTTNTGRGTRVGNRQFIDIYLTGDGGAEGAGTGVLTIAIPVASSASHPFDFFPVGVAFNGATASFIYGYITPGASVISLGRMSSATAIADFTGADQNNASRYIRLKFSYEV